MVISKEKAKIIQTMIESNLITYKHYMLWCENIMNITKNPPTWVTRVYTKTYFREASIVVGNYVDSNSFFKENDYIFYNDLFIACLYLRFIRKELSWATFLTESGTYSDCYDCKWDCSYFYNFLNIYEESYYKSDIQQQQEKFFVDFYDKEINKVKPIYDEFDYFFQQYVTKFCNLNYLMFLDKLTIDNWKGSKCSEETLSQCTFDDVVKKIKLLNGNNHTLVDLRLSNGTTMSIGGGPKFFIVCVSENEENYTLMRPHLENKTMELVAGGQLGEYPLKYCVEIEDVIIAVEDYVYKYMLSNRLTWDKD